MLSPCGYMYSCVSQNICMCAGGQSLLENGCRGGVALNVRAKEGTLLDQVPCCSSSASMKELRAHPPSTVQACHHLQRAAAMDSITPSRQHLHTPPDSQPQTFRHDWFACVLVRVRYFMFGPPRPDGDGGTQTDARFYVIMAWGEALTRTHLDRPADIPSPPHTHTRTHIHRPPNPLLLT